MIIFRKKNLPSNHHQMNVYLDGHRLSPTDHASFLGTTIDCTLNWGTHCTNVANKISKANGLINRGKHLLPSSSLKLLYHSFIQPHIQYALPVWGGCNSQNKKRILSIQKRAIRTISKSYFTAHTEPRMKKLGLLKLDDLYILQNCLLVHDCIYKKAPNTIQNFISLAQDGQHNLRSQVIRPLDLRIPSHKTRVGSSGFSVKGPTAWNDLPNEMRATDQKNRFKLLLKDSILRKYEIKTTCNNPRCRDRNHHTCTVNS